jgi:hypothetical protein
MTNYWVDTEMKQKNKNGNLIYEQIETAIRKKLS